MKHEYLPDVTEHVVEVKEDSQTQMERLVEARKRKGSGLDRYEREVGPIQPEVSEKATKNNGLGLDDWKTVKKSQIRKMYRAGRISVDLAKAYGLSLSDHLHMLNNHQGRAMVNKLMELDAKGIDLHKMDRVARQIATRAVTKAQAVMEAKQHMHVYKNSPEAEEALAAYEAWQRLKKAKEQRGKKGFVVEMTEEETAAIVREKEERNAKVIK